MRYGICLLIGAILCIFFIDNMLLGKLFSFVFPLNKLDYGWYVTCGVYVKNKKMVPFYGTVYKSSLYDLIIPFHACESGAERKKRRAVVFASEKTGKSE